MEDRAPSIAGLPAERATEANPIRVLYIMGVGRSGSTFLAAVLGNHPQLINIGEIYDLARQGWLKDEYCACGLRPSQCGYWRAIRQQWARRVGADDVEGFVRLADQFEPSKHWQARLMRESRAPSPEFRQYARQTVALLEAIRQVSARPVVVDSSKRASRAYALSLMSQVDLRLIHLVRDGRGVAWSKQKKLEQDPKGGVGSLQKPHKAWRSTLGWIRGNLRAELVRRRLGADRTLRIRYEDCVTQPGKVLTDIGRLLDIDFEEVARSIAAGKPLGVGHMITGNRLRMAGQVRVKPDIEWITGMSRFDRWVCWALSGWLLRRYGYQKRPA